MTNFSTEALSVTLDISVATTLLITNSFFVASQTSARTDSMELRTFIKQALLDIVNGITDAQNETQKGTIVPSSSIEKAWVEIGMTKMQVIDFDILVRVEDATGKNAKIGVVSGIFNSGVAGSSSNETGHESRIRLRIPIQYPTSGEITK